MTSQLPARLTAALHEPRARVTVVCGLGGGGEALARAVISELSRGSGPNNPVRSSLAGGDLYTWPGGHLLDLAALAGLGRPRHPGDGQLVPGDGSRVYLVRDRPSAQWIPGADVIDLTENGSDGSALFHALMTAGTGLSPDTAGHVASHYANATALLPELAAWLTEQTRQGSGSPAGTDVLAACRTLPLIQSLFAEIADGTGRALLDIGRVLCLFRPQKLECDDTWAQLASVMSGRPYTVSDISMCLFHFPALFATEWLNGRLVVRPSSALAVTLLEGNVRPTPSEHRRLYRSLRDLAVAQLASGHEIEGTMRRQLPRQAVAGEAIPDLARDAPALLSCDPAALVAELERDPANLRPLGARAVLLAAHRLLENRAQASQLELAGRRIGLDGFCDDIQQELPERPWITSWARAYSVHTHRTLLSRTSPALALCVTQGDAQVPPGDTVGPLGEVFGGCSDGTVWRLRPYGLPTRVWYDPKRPAEIRSVAAVRVAGAILVAIGTSDHSVATIDGVTDEVLWRDENAHTDPVSVVTVTGPPDDPFLASAGVSNQIWLHRIRAAHPEGRLLYTHNSEIRGLAAVGTQAGEFLIFAAVNGAVGIVQVSTGRLAGMAGQLSEVLNGVAVAISDGELIIVGGTNTGRVVRFSCPVADLHPAEGTKRGTARPQLATGADVTRHTAAVNCVRLVEHQDRMAVISASSDHTWRWTWLDTGESTSVVGHVGPVWGAVPAVDQGRLYVVTAGGEGDCRAWLADVVRHEKLTLGQLPRHRGGVTAIGVATNGQQQMCVVTGDGEGEVRSWPPGEANAGGKLADHAGQISALACGYLTADPSVLQVVSGSLDGPLRLTEVRGSDPPSSVILGIAHEGVTALTMLKVRDRQVLISGGLDGTLTAWDLESKLPIGTANCLPIRCGAEPVCHRGLFRAAVRRRRPGRVGIPPRRQQSARDPAGQSRDANHGPMSYPGTARRLGGRAGQRGPRDHPRPGQACHGDLLHQCAQGRSAHRDQFPARRPDRGGFRRTGPADPAVRSPYS
jgi:WD40 repeat protein